MKQYLFIVAALAIAVSAFADPKADFDAAVALAKQGKAAELKAAAAVLEDTEFADRGRSLTAYADYKLSGKLDLDNPQPLIAGANLTGLLAEHDAVVLALYDAGANFSAALKFGNVEPALRRAGLNDAANAMLHEFKLDKQLNASLRVYAATRVNDLSTALAILADAPVNVGQARNLRAVIIQEANKRDKAKMRSEGKSFVGPGKLVRAQAVVDAFNTGVGLSAALAALFPEIQVDVDAGITYANNLKDGFLSGEGVPNAASGIGNIEFWLGVDGFNAFKAAYNGE